MGGAGDREAHQQQIRRSRCSRPRARQRAGRSTRRCRSARSTSSIPARPSPGATTSRSRSATRPTCSAISTIGKRIPKSDLFKELAAGYDKTTGNKIVALTYYGARHTTANKAINKPDDMKGMKLRVPQAPLYPDVRRAPSAPTRRRSPSPKSIWRCRTRRSTGRRTRCRRSRRRSSTRCRRTSTSPGTSSTAW